MVIITIIAINPGHYSEVDHYDPGHVNASLGLREVDINLAVANQMKKLFEDRGHDVVIIHASSLAVITSKANKMGADIFISIHCNSDTNAQIAGTETYYYSLSRAGQRLATLIQNALVADNNTIDRGIKCNPLYVTRNTDAPAVLVELGFLSNQEEGTNLKSVLFQANAAYAIVRATETYLTS